MNRFHVSKIILLVSIFVLLGFDVAISRDYQDSWILEGLEIPFALFVVTYVVAFFLEKRTRTLLMLAVVGRAVFLLIPNLKYVWFQGTYFDQHIQYALANHVYSTGYIPTVNSYNFIPYTTTPLMHVSFSIFSIVPDISVMDSMKYLPVLWLLIYPLLTYIIVEKMEFAQRNSLLKYALFFSSVPVSMEQYLVTGSLFGSVLAFLFLSTFMVFLQKKDRRFWIFCTIFLFAVAAGHSVTSIILSVCLLVIIVIQRASHLWPQLRLQISTALAFASIGAAWLMSAASYTLEVVSFLIFVGAPRGLTPPSEYISPTFFEHARANMLSAIKSFSVYFGADGVFLILSLAGLVVLLKMWKESNSARAFLSLFGWLVLLLTGIGLFMKVGAVRSLYFMRLLFPVLAGLAVFQMGSAVRKRKVRAGILSIVILSVMLLATIEPYGCQPLISSANVLYPDLPANVPISYVNVVNSIYQRQVLGFAENHITGIIATSYPTANQIIGLTEIDYSITHVISYYPIGETQQERRYDYFIISLPGRSGPPPAVKPPLRTTDKIGEYARNSTVIYTNGESYILGQYLP